MEAEHGVHQEPTGQHRDGPVLEGCPDDVVLPNCRLSRVPAREVDHEEAIVLADSFPHIPMYLPVGCHHATF